MAYIQLNSNNPDFGYVIRKNPNAGMQMKPIRKGQSMAWFSNEGTSFNVFFKDADNDVSFGYQEFEYSNNSRYNSPMLVINVITEFFSSTVKELHEKDKSFEKSFVIGALEVKQFSQIQNFEKYFPEFTIESTKIADKIYSLKIRTEKPWFDLLNYVNLMMIFVSLLSDDFVQLDKSNIEKYLAAIKRLDVPFFIRYLFSRMMLKSKGQFNKYKNLLEQSDRYEKISMQYGNTAMQRKDFISSKLEFNKPVLDIGCGEGFYAIDYAPKVDYYHAIDIDENCLTTVKNKMKKKEIENISLYNSLDDYTKIENEEKVDIILTEVIEHMPQEDSRELLAEISKLDFGTLIVTVPNKEFNKFYELSENEMRHDDHDWEPTEEEYRTFMMNVLSYDFKNKDFEFFHIGDEIDGISTSLGCVIKS